ncbi:hypothetical protein LTR53_010510 [Teratosphaeriaceae sp. CCFEE 6253]|nr:hypothetical protein LTR53_010510 [Teratosphaeriaceae sp. CCFEE 6253]
MAHQRALSTTAPGGTHAVSLKVLRLSRPSLATQTPLPPTDFGHGLDIPKNASLAYPGADEHSSFPLVPLLTLPSAFGAAYVGEAFTCTLCANNEIQEGETRSVSGVRIRAELQTPSDKAGTTLELTSADGAEEAAAGDVPPGATLQRTLRHELKEEGPHVLAVTVSYTETLHSDEGGASGGRARSFRKLYQFVAQQLIAVRSKITERKRREKDAGRQWILEAQLENVGEASAVLEKVWLHEREGISSRACNGDLGKEATVLKPQDVEQVMFVLEEETKPEGELGGRVPLAQVNIDWRGAMGERGSLTTGWLASKGR